MEQIDIQHEGVFRCDGSKIRKDFFFYNVEYYLTDSGRESEPDYELDKFEIQGLISDVITRDCTPEVRSVLLSDIVRDCIKYIVIPPATINLARQFTKNYISDSDKNNEIKWQDFFNLLLDPEFDPQLRAVVLNLLKTSKSYITEITRCRKEREAENKEEQKSQEKEKEKEKEKEDIQAASFLISGSFSRLLQVDPDPRIFSAAGFQLRKMLGEFFKSNEVGSYLTKLEVLVEPIQQPSENDENEMADRLHSMCFQQSEQDEQKSLANEYIYSSAEIPVETARIVIEQCLNKLDCSKVNIHSLAGDEICEGFILKQLIEHIERNRKNSPDNKLEQINFAGWLDDFVLFKGKDSTSSAHNALLNILKNTFYLASAPEKTIRKYESYIGAKLVSNTKPDYEVLAKKFIARIKPTKHENKHDTNEYKRLILDIVFIGEKLLQENKALSTETVSTYVAGILQHLLSKNSSQIGQDTIRIQIESIAKDLNDLYQKMTIKCVENPRDNFVKLCNIQGEKTTRKSLYKHFSPPMSSSSSSSSSSSPSSSSSFSSSVPSSSPGRDFYSMFTKSRTPPGRSSQSVLSNPVRTTPPPFTLPQSVGAKEDRSPVTKQVSFDAPLSPYKAREEVPNTPRFRPIPSPTWGNSAPDSELTFPGNDTTPRTLVSLNFGEEGLTTQRVELSNSPESELLPHYTIDQNKPKKNGRKSSVPQLNRYPSSSSPNIQLDSSGGSTLPSGTVTRLDMSNIQPLYSRHSNNPSNKGEYKRRPSDLLPKHPQKPEPMHPLKTLAIQSSGPAKYRDGEERTRHKEQEDLPESIKSKKGAENFSKTPRK